MEQPFRVLHSNQEIYNCTCALEKTSGSVSKNSLWRVLGDQPMLTESARQCHESYQASGRN